MDPTNINNPEGASQSSRLPYARPAHTPVPEYIRLIAAEKYTEAYMINWESNVFPGALGRTCDRPCEPVLQAAGGVARRWLSVAQRRCRQ
ncbi:MAG: hypothetical protein R3B47_10015 [Bacteroidia bacterium]